MSAILSVVFPFLYGMAFVAGAFVGCTGVMFMVRRDATSDREYSKEQNRLLLEMHEKRNKILLKITSLLEEISER